ncbi:MAG: type III polyketide synthase [Bacteroidetes bacterium]|nr:type III polyketide synthase [Bacteroidota bacterium]
MLVNISTALPPYKSTQDDTIKVLKDRIGENEKAIRLINSVSNNSEIDTRYFVVPDACEIQEENFFSKNGDYHIPDTLTRMKEYEKWAKQLSVLSVTNLLSENDIDPQTINRIITVSCTGFFAPGLDYHLINTLNLPRNIKKTNIGFMGCAASVNAFNCVLESIESSKEKNNNILMLSVELCSLHLHTDATIDNIISNTIFADGCASAFFTDSTKYSNISKLKLINTFSIMFDNSHNMMGWKVGNFGFEMKLSHKLPKIILETAVPRLKEILLNNGIRINEIKHWVLHPGGKAILDALQNGLNLSDELLYPSRKILRNFGNMSSATILFILKEILETKTINKNDLCCVVAFGPGLVMEIALFKGI